MENKSNIFEFPDNLSLGEYIQDFKDTINFLQDLNNKYKKKIKKLKRKLKNARQTN